MSSLRFMLKPELVSMTSIIQHGTHTPNEHYSFLRFGLRKSVSCYDWLLRIRDHMRKSSPGRFPKVAEFENGRNRMTRSDGKKLGKHHCVNRIVRSITTRSHCKHAEKNVLPSKCHSAALRYRTNPRYVPESATRAIRRSVHRANLTVNRQSPKILQNQYNLISACFALHPLQNAQSSNRFSIGIVSRAAANLS